MTFEEAGDRVFERFFAGGFAEALALAEEAERRFPGQSALTAYWRACLLARLEREDDAVAALRDELGDGSWWSAALLLEDDDLAPLRGREDFRSLVDDAQRQADAARAGARPELLGGRGSPQLLALHGRYGSAGAALELWEAAAPGVAALNSSQWLLSAGDRCWDDLETADAELRWAFAELGSSQPLVLGGFSQGATVAMRAALAGVVPAAGFVAVVPTAGRVGMPRLEELGALLPGAAARGVRGAIVTGSQDGGIDDQRAFAAAAEAAGLALRLEVVEGLGHAFPDDFAERAPGLVAFVLAGR